MLAVRESKLNVLTENPFSSSTQDTNWKKGRFTKDLAGAVKAGHMLPLCPFNGMILGFYNDELN